MLDGALRGDASLHAVGIEAVEEPAAATARQQLLERRYDADKKAKGQTAAATATASLSGNLSATD